MNKLNKELAVAIERNIARHDDYLEAKEQLVIDINLILRKTFGDELGIANGELINEIQNLIENR